MGPTRELIDALYREEILQARRLTPEQRLLAGPRLFDSACEVAKAGIRWQHPDANEDQVLNILRQRLVLARRLEESPC